MVRGGGRMGAVKGKVRLGWWWCGGGAVVHFELDPSPLWVIKACIPPQHHISSSPPSAQALPLLLHPTPPPYPARPNHSRSCPAFRSLLTP